jgi:hypothetical protein
VDGVLDSPEPEDEDEDSADSLEAASFDSLAFDVLADSPASPVLDSAALAVPVLRALVVALVALAACVRRFSAEVRAGSCPEASCT